MVKSKTYLGFEDIPTFNFYKIAETMDVRWFYRGYRESGEEFEVDLAEQQKLLERYKEIYDARVNYTDNVKTMEYNRKLEEVSNLETKLFRMTSSFDLLNDMEFDIPYFQEFVEYFKNEGYTYKEAVTLANKDEYLLWLQTKIKGFRTKVKIKKSLYKDILEPKDIDESAPKFDLVKEKLMVQEALETKINIYKCPLIEWSAMVLRCEEKSRESKKRSDKMKNKRR